MTLFFQNKYKEYTTQCGFLPVLSSNKDVKRCGHSNSKAVHISLKALNPFFDRISTKRSPRAEMFCSLKICLSSSQAITPFFDSWLKIAELVGSSSFKKVIQPMAKAYFFQKQLFQKVNMDLTNSKKKFMEKVVKILGSE